MSLAEDIKILREKTGAGLMDCKKALIECKDDMEQAIVFLRKKGLADMAKRSDRETNAFIKLADDLAQYVLEHPGLDYSKDEHIKNMILEQAPKFGENTTFKGGYNWAPADGNVMAYYVHSDNKKASLLEMSVTGACSDAAKVQEIARGLAMHTVGMQTGWVDAKDIPQEVIDRELDIYKTQAINEGKPAETIEKMLPGKVKKFAKENCLLEQPTIKDNKKTVAAYLDEESKALGCELKVVRFVRF